MVTIRLGDCIKIMQEIHPESIATIFSDPPYNTGNKQNKVPEYDRNMDFQKKAWMNFHAEWDSIENYYLWSLEWMSEAHRVLIDGGSIWVCGSFHNIPEVALALKEIGFWTIQWVAWCIPNGFPHLSGKKMTNGNQTLIWARKGDKHFYDYAAAKGYTENGTNLRDFWLINNDSQAGKLWKHPSKKPINLVQRAINISTPKDTSATILDPFGGSGTTGVAANNLGLDCILIDNKPEYVEMMERRLH